MNRTEFLNYIQRFRGIAIIFVVAGHCIRFFKWDNHVQTERVLNAIFLNGTILFVFIAGFLFQHLSSKYQYRDYFIRKCKTVLFPYLVISIPIIVYTVFIDKVGHWAYANLSKEPVLIQVGWYYLTGKHLAPLWFIPMITIFYLLFPLFIYLDRWSKVYYFFLPISILISIIVHRPPAESNIPQMFLHLFSIYILGMWVSRNRDGILALVEKVQIPLILLLVALFGVELCVYKQTGVIYVKTIFAHGKELIDINLIQKIILSILMVYYLKKIDHIIQDTFIDKMLITIADLSFGIYFIHYYFLDALIRTKRVFHYDIDGGLFYYIGIVAITTFVSVMVLKTIKSATGSWSRYMVGC